MHVGTVKELWRYPVKSMKGQSLRQTGVYWYGLEGDRRYAFVIDKDYTTFPWLTARELPDLVRYQPHFEDDRNPSHARMRITTPDGQNLAITDPALRQHLSDEANDSIRLMQLNRGASDTGSISLISTATLGRLNETFGKEVDARRFRQNIIIDPAEHSPYVEDSWIGNMLVFGHREDSAQLLLVRPIQRCVMINVDPETGQKDARILKGVNATRDNCFGVYAWPRKVGTIEVGDEIHMVQI